MKKVERNRVRTKTTNTTKTDLLLPWISKLITAANPASKKCAQIR